MPTVRHHQTTTHDARCQESFLRHCSAAAAVGSLSTRYRVFRKSSDIVSPVATFLFQDVTPQNLCTPAFIVHLPGRATGTFFHFPAAHHNRAGVVGFTDGHVEAHRWRDGRTIRTAALGTKIGHNFSSPNNPDLRWIQERTSALK